MMLSKLWAIRRGWDPARARLLVGGALLLVVLLGIWVVYRPAAESPGALQSLPLADAGAPRSLAVDPRDGGLLKATSRGLFRSRDRGRSWTPLPVPAPLAQSGFSHVVVNPQKPTLIYAAGVGAGVILSEDDGATWRRIVTGLPSMEIEALAIHASQQETLFVSIPRRGIYRTEDGGRRWLRMDGGPGKPVLALAHSLLPGSMNTGWLYAGTLDGTYLSMDCF